MFRKYRNRHEAGVLLAEKLQALALSDDTVFLALPRGGVPVGFEVARILQRPLDVLLVRKLGVPNHDEYAMGAISLGGVRVMNDDVVHQMNISESAIERVLSLEQAELARRNKAYRQGKPPPDIVGKTALVIDDGLATGATMMAAIKALREMQAAKIIVAVPVGAASTVERLQRLADKVVCLHIPEPFYGVGRWYERFSQTSDETVLELLAQANSGDIGQVRSLTHD